MTNFRVETINENGKKATQASRGAKTSAEAVEIAKKFMTWREKESIVEYIVTTLDGSQKVEVFQP